MSKLGLTVRDEAGNKVRLADYLSMDEGDIQANLKKGGKGKR